MAATGGLTPVQISKERAPWWSGMPSPLTAAAPAARDPAAPWRQRLRAAQELPGRGVKGRGSWEWAEKECFRHANCGV